MDMTVNRLPARTWNWLKMNETVLSSVEPFRQQEISETGTTSGGNNGSTGTSTGDLGGKRFPGRK